MPIGLLARGGKERRDGRGGMDNSLRDLRRACNPALNFFGRILCFFGRHKVIGAFYYIDSLNADGEIRKLYIEMCDRPPYSCKHKSWDWQESV